MEEYRARPDAQLFDALKRGDVSGAYYLFGDEEYAIEQAEKRFLGLLLPAAAALNALTLDAPQAADVIAACETLPFFDERRLVFVRRLSADEGGKLAAYVSRVPESTLLVISERGDAAKGALSAKMRELGRAVEFAAYDETMAAAFAQKRAKELGCALDRLAARKLVDMVGTSLRALESAAAKAAAYAGYGNPVTEQHLDACIAPNIEYRIFTMLDRLVAGDKKAGLAALAGLIHSGENALGLAAFLEGRLRQMLVARELTDSGLSDEAAAKKLSGNAYAARMSVKNAKKLTRARLERAVIAFGQVDLLQKQGRMQDRDAVLLAALENF